ncbi:MAG: sugar ABC transporter ATP-binding protein [Anaerolineae bacterium]
MSNVGAVILKVDKVSKRFGGVQALRDVDFDLRAGEVHALVGENGAGKSTLMNILGGVFQRDSGTITFKGQEINFRSPTESIAAGIAVIHQELAMMPQLNVIENIYMGRMPTQLGRVRWRRAEQDTRAALARVGLAIDPYAMVSDLSISQRQLVEIAKALSMNADLIVMDEPNSSLSSAETERLFDVIHSLTDQGVAVIYVSHKLEEVLRIGDRISVLRDGEYRGTLDQAEATIPKVVQLMVGRELAAMSEAPQAASGPVRLEVKNLSGERFRDVSFTVYQGEIVGFAGLVGAGRSEVARAIFGADRVTGGEIRLDGRPVHFRAPSQAISRGLAMVPEDRKVLALFQDQAVLFNMSMAYLPLTSPYGIIPQTRVRKTAGQFVNRLDIKLASLDQAVRNLSGGNQQKTILARWLATEPKLLILDEPTHGVDIGAKAEIYELMRELAAAGISIILISSELPEIMSMCDRVVVMHEGRVTGILDRAECDESTIMLYATGLVGQDTQPQGEEKQV